MTTLQYNVVIEKINVVALIQFSAESNQLPVLGLSVCIPSHSHFSIYKYKTETEKFFHLNFLSFFSIKRGAGKQGSSNKLISWWSGTILHVTYHCFFLWCSWLEGFLVGVSAKSMRIRETGSERGLAFAHV